MTMGDMKNDAATASLAPMALYTVMFPVFKEVKNKKKKKKREFVTLEENWNETFGK